MKHVRTNPRAALHVSGPDVWSFAVAEGEAILPEHMQPAHPDAFFLSMVEELQVVIRLHVHRLYGAALNQG